MYTSHFGFNEKPFKLKSDTRYIYSNPQLQEQLAELVDSLTTGQALTLVVGPAGSGKSTLIRQLVDAAPAAVDLVRFPNPSLPFSGLVEQFCSRLDLDTAGQALGEQIHQLQSALRLATSSGNRVVLVIDDAEILDQSIIQDLIGLSRSDNADTPLFLLVIAGLAEVATGLAGEEARTVKLSALPETEVEAYIQHQLNEAGAGDKAIFTPNALELIADFTHGNPRTINSLCDAALFIAAMEGQSYITPEIVDRAAQQCFLKEPARSTSDAFDDDNDPSDDAQSIAPIQPAQLTGLSENDARAALGLRFGDVSAEIAETVPGDDFHGQPDLGQAYPEPDTPELSPRPNPAEALDVTQVVKSGRDESNREAETPEIAQQWNENTDHDATLAAPIEPLPVPEPPILSEPPMHAEPYRPNPQKRRFSILGIVGKLLILTIILGIIGWFKPGLLGLKEGTMQRQVEMLRERLMPSSEPGEEPANQALPQATTENASRPNTDRDSLANELATARSDEARVEISDEAAPHTPLATTSESHSAAASEAIRTPALPTTDSEPAGTLRSADAVSNDADSTPDPLTESAPSPANTADGGLPESPQASGAETAAHLEPTESPTDPAPTSSVPSPIPVPVQPATDSFGNASEPIPAQSAATENNVGERTYINSLLEEPSTDAAPTNERAARIDQLLALADEQIAAQLLTTPAGNNAFESYLEILAMDPEHQGAEDGLIRIREIYKDWATAAKRRGANARALNYYRRAARVDPNDSATISAMRDLEALTD